VRALRLRTRVEMIEDSTDAFELADNFDFVERALMILYVRLIKTNS
jgi:hypothetical protein